MLAFHLRMGSALLAFVVALFLPSVSLGESPLVRSAYHDYRVVTWVSGLSHPWSIAFVPGGDVLVTEQPGRLRIVRNGALLDEAVPGVPPVFYEGQGGLMDVVPHPDFASNRLLYLSFSKPHADGNGATTAVVRGHFENDRLTDVEEIFEAVSRGRGR